MCKKGKKNKSKQADVRQEEGALKKNQVKSGDKIDDSYTLQHLSDKESHLHEACWEDGEARTR